MASGLSAVLDFLRSRKLKDKYKKKFLKVIATKDRITWLRGYCFAQVCLVLNVIQCSVISDTTLIGGLSGAVAEVGGEGR